MFFPPGGYQKVGQLMDYNGGLGESMANVNKITVMRVVSISFQNNDGVGGSNSKNSNYNYQAHGVSTFCLDGCSYLPPGLF